MSLSNRVVYGKFSENAGSKVRRVYDASGNLLGTITKRDDGGYRVVRVRDGKVREKRYLEDAFKTIRRAN